MYQQPRLRKTEEEDIEVFFENQADDEAVFMAAFTSKDPKDKEAYVSKWKRLMYDPSVHMQTIMLGDKIAGTVVKFEMGGDAEITYALNKEYWGKGIATKALKEFLLLEKKRPIYGHAAADNLGSVRVLEKCSFKFIRKKVSFANARGKEIEEVIYWLEK
jgi:[ribosomal protein S5]-alanine N-acetyltransferase